MSPDKAEQLGYHGDTLRGYLSTLRNYAQQDEKRFRVQMQAVFKERSFPPRTDVDAMLYDGFFGRQDKQQFLEVIEANANQLRERSWVFNDARLPELLFRYRARNYPESLTELETQQWREHCRANLVSDGPFSLEVFHTALTDELARPDLTPHQQAALADLAQYAQELQQRLSA